MTIPSTIPSASDDISQVLDFGRRVQVLAVGPGHESEFSLIQRQIAEAIDWQTKSDLSAASDYLDACGEPPELILLAQSLPGEYGQCEVDSLQCSAPLARIVIVAGTWCEGEMRTGTIPTGVIRLYWYEFAPWWRAAMRVFQTGLCPPWSLPLDEPQAGRRIGNAQVDRLCFNGPIAIDAGDYAVYETLSAALVVHGIKTVWTRQHTSIGVGDAAAGIWDGGQLSDRELVRLGSFCRQLQPQDGKVVALLDFPRVEHYQQARDAGAATVFGKPYVVDEVLAALT